MYRRRYLATATVAGVTLAGCLGQGADGVDESDVAVLDGWLQDAVELAETGRRGIAAWLDDPATVDLTALETLESDAGALLTRWAEEVDPKLEPLRNTDIDRSVGEETWLVEGEELANALLDLRETTAGTRTGAGAVVTAEGDPDRVGAETMATLEALPDRNAETVDTAIELWFRDTLE